MHHVLYLEENEIYDKGIVKPNEGDGSSGNFLEYLNNYLIPLSETIPVYIYAGDVGAFEGGNLSPFYKKAQGKDVFFLGTGLGNNSNDSILIVEANDSGEISIYPFSLNGKKMNTIDTYNLEYWTKQ